jgi:hypothetical protein
MLEPASAEPTAYEDVEAPEIAVQLAPVESHRRHAYAYDVGLFDHDPGDALRV